MKARQLSSVALVALVATWVSACSPDTPKEEAPIVNDENCKLENISKIGDKATREEFSAACLRRGPGFKPSQQKAW
jgi:entry exclusion lipoprotein TrbK